MATRQLDVTRIVCLSDLIDREEATNACTRIASIQSRWTSLKGAFNAHQREMAIQLVRETRPGLMVFLLAPTGVQGWVWLAATDGLRAGTLGRHGCVDLHVPRESGLSLRHCLFLVRRGAQGVVTHVVDLSSSAGIRLEDQKPVRALSADGHFFLHVPGAVLACFPTGAKLPWDPDALPAFDTLAPRRIVSQREGAPVIERPQPAPFESCVTVVAGPVIAAPGEVLENGEAPAGMLTLASPFGRERLAVGLSALDKGVVVGRYERCAGGSAALGDDRVSRVHALLIRRDERVWLADAGSTNGTWLGEEEIKCAPIIGGAVYHLGERATLAWTALD